MATKSEKAEGKEGTTSFWATLPGILTAIAGLITAGVGAYAIIMNINNKPSNSESISEGRTVLIPKKDSEEKENFTPKELPSSTSMRMRPHRTMRKVADSPPAVRGRHNGAGVLSTSLEPNATVPKEDKPMPSIEPNATVPKEDKPTPSINSRVVNIDVGPVTIGGQRQIPAANETHPTETTTTTTGGPGSSGRHRPVSYEGPLTTNNTPPTVNRPLSLSSVVPHPTITQPRAISGSLPIETRPTSPQINRPLQTVETRPTRPTSPQINRPLQTVETRPDRRIRAPQQKP